MNLGVLGLAGIVVVLVGVWVIVRSLRLRSFWYGVVWTAYGAMVALTLLSIVSVAWRL